MIAEVIELPIDIDRLRDELMGQVAQKPIVSRSAAVGGWALQSTNGSYADGWDMEFNPYNGPHNLGPQFVPINDKQKKLRAVQDYRLPTEINSLYLQETLNILEAQQLNPRKARVIRLSARSESAWHQDGVSHYYQARIHIPLITNPKCFFENKIGKVHMEYGKIYLVHINQPHRIVNEGSEARYHFVAHIWDRKPVSKYHIYSQDKNLGCSYLPESFD